MTRASDQIAAKLPKPTKAKTPKAPPRRKPGLLHSLRAVEVEDVRLSMRRTCAKCGEVPRVRRLLVRTGSGRHGKTDAYCGTCGRAFLSRTSEEYIRALQYLTSGRTVDGGTIRL